MANDNRDLSEDQAALLRAITLHLHLQSTRSRQSLQLTVFGVGAAVLGVVLLFAMTMVHGMFFIIALAIGVLAFALLGYRAWIVYEQQQRIDSQIELLDEQLPYRELFESGDELSKTDLETLSEAFPQLDDS